MSIEEAKKPNGDLPDDSGKDLPQDPLNPPQDPPCQRPYWRGPPDEPVQPRPAYVVLENIIARLRSQSSQQGSAQGQQGDPGSKAKPGIIRRKTAPPHPDALLRARLKPGRDDQSGAKVPVPKLFDPHTSLSLHLKGPTEPGDNYSYGTKPLPAISKERTLAKDQFPRPAEGLIGDLVARYEAAYGSLKGAIDADPTGVTREQVRTFIAETAALDLELSTTIAAYMEEYAQAARAVMWEYLQHKNSLEGLVASGEREEAALKSEEEAARVTYHAHIAELKTQIGQTKTAFFNFVFKALAIAATHELLREFLASRETELKNLETILDNDASSGDKLQAFVNRCTEAGHTTAALSEVSREIPNCTGNAVADNMLAIHRLLTHYAVPAFLADSITDNGVSFEYSASGGALPAAPDSQSSANSVTIDPAKVMELTGTHLQALQGTGHDLNAWGYLRRRSGTLDRELALLRRLVDETLPVRAPVAGQPKHSTSHPAQPNPPSGTASEPRQ